MFTTLRIQDRAVFAWDRHWTRLSNDARLINLQMPTDRDALEAELLQLVAANDLADGTMRLVLFRNAGGMWEHAQAGQQPTDVIAMTADLKSWGDSVRLSIQPHGRYAAGEFAGAKLNSWAQNLTWAERAQQAGFDETVLLNEKGSVAECTSANIFAVFGSEVRTPPLSDGCLPGITRQILLTETAVPGISVTESTLTLDELYAADDVFITSTTRDLLAVREISGRIMNLRSDVRKTLAEAFRRFLHADVASRRTAPARA